MVFNACMGHLCIWDRPDIDVIDENSVVQRIYSCVMLGRGIISQAENYTNYENLTYNL